MTMPRGTGAKTRRSARRAAGQGEVEGARRALDPAPVTASAAAPALATDAELDALLDTLAPKVGACTNCSHMAASHVAGGACSVAGCTCTGLEMEAAESSLYDAVEYAGDAGALSVVGFDPADDRFDAAVAELVHRSPAAEPLVRLRLDELRLRRFAPESPAPPLTPPLDAGGNPYSLEWDAVLCPEGKLTEDGRAFAPGAIRWRELPLSLAAMLETQPGHDGAKVCGRIDRIWRDDAAGFIRAAGVFDDSEWGHEIARLVADRTLRGNSVDIAPLEVEVGPQSRWFDENGNWIPQTEAAQAEDTDIMDVLFGEPGDEPTIVVVNDAVIGMSTVCPFPAFADASIAVGQSVVASGSPLVWTLKVDAGYRLTRGKAKGALPPDYGGGLQAPTGVTGVVASLAGGMGGAPSSTAAVVAGGSGGSGVTVTASGVAVSLGEPGPQPVVGPHGNTIGTWTLDGGSLPAEALTAAVKPPVHPPAAWFADPELEQLTPLTVDERGRVFGHAAGWGSCHTGFPDVCVTPPRSETGYRFFHLKTVECDDGTTVDVGTVTLEAPHANQMLGLVDATSHYENTGMAAVDVVVGDDEHGIWVAGAVRPHLTAEAIRELRGASLSGDWRNYEGNLELVALLAVNVPGFPIPKVHARVASGVMQTLVAAGVIAEHEHDWGDIQGGFAYCACGVRKPMTDQEAATHIWGAEFPPAVDADTAAKLTALASMELAAVAE